MKNVWIVLVAEVKRRLTSRAFQLGVVIGMLGVAGMIKLPSLVAANVGANQSKAVLAGDPSLTARAKPLLAGEYTIVGTRTETSAPTAAELDRYGAGRMIAFQTRAVRCTSPSMRRIRKRYLRSISRSCWRRSVWPSRSGSSRPTRNAC